MSTQTKFIKALAANINRLRQERKLSFQKMADACDMDKAQVYKICTQGIDIKASTIVKISKGLEVPITELLNFKP